jgi:hypothetical protein
MSMMSRPVLGCFLAVPLLALQGCAMLEDATTGASQQPATTTALGGSGSFFMRAGLQPFSLANCMKFEAVPQECERAIIGNQ